MTLVLFAHGTLSEGLLNDLTSSCETLHLAYSRWDGTTSAQSAPDLVVAALKQGERRIPEDIVTLMNTMAVDSRLLLFSRDPLVQPLVYLRGGHVVLATWPESRDQVARCLRAAVAISSDGSTNTNLFLRLDDANLRVASEEHLGPSAWVAGVRSIAATGQDQALYSPLVRQAVSTGATIGILSKSHPPACDVEAIIARLHNDPELENLDTLVGPEIGIVQLNKDANEWTFYWPDGARPLVLFSSNRLPERWDVAATIDARGKRFMRTAASRGDRVIAMSGQLAQLASSEQKTIESEKIAAAAQCGAPALLEFIVARLAEAPHHFSAVIAEVR